MSSTTANYPSTHNGTERHVRRLTETKAGVKTTEFLMSVAFVAAVLIAAYIDDNDSFTIDDGWRYAAIVAAAYAISRGLAKLGVREPYTDRVESP